MNLPALKARQGTFHRREVLNISKPAEGLKGGDVGLFWDQQIGLEILRRANAYPQLVESLRLVIRSLGSDVFSLTKEQRRDMDKVRNLLAEHDHD